MFPRWPVFLVLSLYCILRNIFYLHEHRNFRHLQRNATPI